MSGYVRHLFIVRVWLEAGDASHAAQWRGSVEHVPAGPRLYFTSLEDLVDFIALRRGGTATHLPLPPGDDQPPTSDQLYKERNTTVKTLFIRSSSRKFIATLIALFALSIGLSSVSAQTIPGGAGKLTPAAPTDTQYFQDIAPGSFFYPFTTQLYLTGVVSGYACGTPPAGACVPPNNLPYYVPNNNVTRGLMSIYIANARTKPGIDIERQSSDTHVGPALILGNAQPNGVGLQSASYASGSGSTYDTASSGVLGIGTGSNHSFGVYGYSLSDAGGAFDTNSPSNVYGLSVKNGGLELTGTSADLYVTRNASIHGNLIVSGSKTGYVVDIMRNDGGHDLHPGDVVAFSSNAAAPALLGTIPVANAVAAGKAYDTAVLGVVDEQWLPGDAGAAPDSKQAQGKYGTNTTAVHPGAYMSVVTLGAYKAVKVNASNGPVHVGDLLTTSAVAGEAMRVGDKDKLAAFGAVIGKAMGNLDSGAGTIPVMVTLR